MNIITGSWDELRAHAQPIRFEVFVDEQKVPAEIELDEMDPHCVHAVAYDEAGQPLATGRLLPDGHIGRMAVRKAGRGQGVGGAVLQVLIAAARARRCRGHPQCADPRRGLLPALRLCARGRAVHGSRHPHITMRARLQGRSG
jgi:GNAT superfamily N-acetyltransferase